MDWWVLELLTDALLVGLALWMGPLIKRFGKSYAADVFRANPRTGKSFIVLTDIAYYLIFAAYIMFTIRYAPAKNWGRTVDANQLQHETARIGGILLIIGVLHGVNLLALPVMGRLLTLNRQLDDGAITEAAQLAARAANPRSDVRGSAEYKRDVVRVYVQRALHAARSLRRSSRSPGMQTNRSPIHPRCPPGTCRSSRAAMSRWRSRATAATRCSPATTHTAATF